MSEFAGKFFWFELMTSDMRAAESFYKTVVGWDMAPFGKGESPEYEGPEYTVLTGSAGGMGGIMTLPPETAGLPPCWVGYIASDDVDADAKKVEAAGGSIHRQPWDIAGVGRVAVVADPQGATFLLLTPSSANDSGPAVMPMQPGHVAWHELHTTDWSSGFDFYAGQFGWTKADAMDMGPMGTYQIFQMDGENWAGGMMNDPNFPRPAWLFYFQVGDIDEAAERVTAAGGKLLFGPSEVPGEAWIINAQDPQGAFFALVGDRAAKGE